MDIAWRCALHDMHGKMCRGMPSIGPELVKALWAVTCNDNGGKATTERDCGQ